MRVATSDAPPTDRSRPPAVDVRDVGVDDLAGVDAIVHLAALSNDPLGDLDPALTDAINHHASVRLARLAREAGVQRFVFSSSCSNYGAAGDGLVDEDATLRPLTPYAVSKVRVERGARRARRAATSARSFLRNATAYGVSPRLRCDLVLNDLVGWAHATGRVLVRSDGTPWRPLVHVEDIAAACLAALTAPARRWSTAQAFNVGRTDENYRVSEIAEIVRETVPGSRVEYAAGAGPDQRSYRVSFEKIRAAAAELHAALDRARRGTRARRRLPRARPLARPTSRARATGGSAASAPRSTRGGLDRDRCRRARRGA